MLVGNFRELIEAPSSKMAEAIEMRLHRSAQARLHVEIEQVAQSAIDAVKVHPATIRRHQASRRVIARRFS
jgi:hypothetical protein